MADEGFAWASDPVSRDAVYHIANAVGGPVSAYTISTRVASNTNNTDGGVAIQTLSTFEKHLANARVAVTEEEKDLLGKWAGNPQVEAAFDALLDGRNVVDLIKLIMPHDIRTLPKLAVGPVISQGSNLSGMIRGNTMRLTAPTGATRLDWELMVNIGGQRDGQLWDSGTTAIPAVPPSVMPPLTRKASREWLILFEAEWRRAPVPRTTDPALLKPISGTLYEVVAVWDLTALEAAALSTAIRIRN